MATVRTRNYFTNLFITGYKPTQTNYADLFLTVPMKKETADRARVTTGSSSLETEVGLVVLATNAQAKTNTTQLSDRSLVVQPSQLPTIVAISNSVSEDMPTTVLESIADVAVTTRNKYDVRPTSTWITWLLSRLFKTGGVTGQVPRKVDGTAYNWSWSTLAFSDLSGTATDAQLPVVPITKGGTGQITAPLAINALLPTKVGNTLKVLRVNAAENDVEWISNADSSKSVVNDQYSNIAQTVTTSEVNVFTYTTLNDGFTKKYKVNFSCMGYIEELDATGRTSNISVKLYVNGIIIKEKKIPIFSLVGTSRSESNYTLHHAASITPNQVIAIKVIKETEIGGPNTVKINYQSLSIFGIL